MKVVYIEKLKGIFCFYQRSLLLAIGLHAIFILLFSTGFKTKSIIIQEQADKKKHDQVMQTHAVSEEAIEKTLIAFREKEANKLKVQKELEQKSKTMLKQLEQQRKQFASLKSETSRLDNERLKNKQDIDKELDQLKSLKIKAQKELAQLHHLKSTLQEKTDIAQRRLEEAEKKKVLAKEIKEQKPSSAAINQSKQNIIAVIRRFWRITPEQLNKNLTCKLAISLNDNAEVTSIKILQSSGDITLDRSAVSAVYKASPFLDLKKEGILDIFKVFNLTLRADEAFV